jgi:hypothetical protein
MPILVQGIQGHSHGALAFVTASSTEFNNMNQNIADKRRRYKCVQACTTCKRRKEKCDGNTPCARCVKRGVHANCEYRTIQHSIGAQEDYVIPRNDAQTQQLPTIDSITSMGQRQDLDSHNPLTLVASNASNASIPETARLIQDSKGKYMFIGDSANLALLQSIRGIVSNSIGTCPFIEDPLRSSMVESVPEGLATWLHAADTQPPIKPSLDEAVYLTRWYILATNCVLDLFDEGDLLGNLPGWLNDSSDQNGALTTIYNLVFAIGAQTCLEDKDTVANRYFDYGRYLTASYFMEDPSITTVQVCALITMYLLGSSRRNAAFMYLGTAVRAAYALGLHRYDVSKLFSSAELETRERTWKTMRILDLFMSASLGRPPSTEETRNTEEDERYSASIDLCRIFEQILTDVYAKRMISTEILQKISQHHRRWTMRFHQGLDTDRISYEESIEGGLPNIGLIHVKEAYYWTIILLTRPFFVEYISNHISLRSQTEDSGTTNLGIHSSHKVLVHACVNSAICTINLLRPLLGPQQTPRRLPFVVNSLFVSGLVLGLAYFGDLYDTYPLNNSLETTLELFSLFPSDAIAKRNLSILRLMQDSCQTYVTQQSSENFARHSRLVSDMFGQVDNVLSKSGLAANANGYNNSFHTGRPEQLSRQPGLFGQTKSTATVLHTSDDVSVISNSEAATMNTPEYSGRNAPSSASNAANSGLTGFQDDFSMLPIISPMTLWFGSYEDNTPLFSTIDARDFL